MQWQIWLTGCWLLCLTSFSLAGQYNDVMAIGDPLPQFTDLPAVDGKRYAADDWRDRVLVIVSLSNSCPFSRGIETDLKALVDKVADQSVAVVAVSYNISEQDQLPAMRQRAQQRGFNFTYLRDDSQQLGRQLGTSVTPEFFVFNQERKLVYMGLLHNSPAMAQGEPGEFGYLRGPPEEFYVEAAIQAALAGKLPETTETRPYGCTVEYVN